MLWAFLATLFGSAGAIAAFIHFLRKGQFEDAEDVKYQMFREEED